MKFTIARDQALASMNRIQRVVERRNTIPILANVLLKAQASGSLILRATDLDLELSETIPATVESAGSTTVPAHMLYDILRKLPAGSQVSFEAKEGAIAVKTGRSRFTLHTLQESDMPSLGEGDMDVEFAIAAGDLRALIDRTRFAISTEETRYYLNGIYLHIVEDRQSKFLRAVATDGHRLAQTQVPAPKGADGMRGVIFPRKAVGELQKIVESAEDEVTVELSANKIRFTRGAVVLTSKLIDGTFPDYARVIPQNNNKILTLAKKDFYDAVDRVSTVSTERGRAIKLSLTQNRLTMTVTNPDSGAAVEEMDVSFDDAGAGEFEIGFNSRYLLDICEELEGEEAIVKLSEAGAPALMSSAGDENSLFVLMPMRV
jgi:DNA polymerase-3 subunit beta